MIGFADPLPEWLAVGRPVSIVRVISTKGFSSRERAALAAFSPGEAAVAGSIFSGAMDAQLRARLDAAPGLRAILDLALTDDEATGAGLSCGGSARLLVQPATDIDSAGWTALLGNGPACLVTALAGDDVGMSAVFTTVTIDDGEQRFGPGVRRLLIRGTSQTAVLDTSAGHTVATALWPVPRLVVVGEGQIAKALAAAAGLLDWTTQVVNSPTEASDAIEDLNQADAVVVLSHDRAVDGPALLSALSGSSGYIGGLGSAHTQAARSSWLAEAGLSGEVIARIHGPAGLDIGAFSPAEIAIAIMAEIIAARSGATGGSLRGRTSPIRPS